MPPSRTFFIRRKIRVRTFFNAHSNTVIHSSSWTLCESQWLRSAPRFSTSPRVVASRGHVAVVTSTLGKFPGRNGRKCHLERGSGVGAALLQRQLVFFKQEPWRVGPTTVVVAKLCHYEMYSTGIIAFAGSRTPSFFQCA